MDIQTLESWLWEAACAIRGPVDAPKYKDYILPLIFLKRLSDVFEDEVKQLASDSRLIFYDAMEIVEAEIRESGKAQSVRFYIPPEARWERLRRLSVNVGEKLTEAVRKVTVANPKLRGIFDQVDFNATAAGQRIIPDDTLRQLINILSKHRLGIHDVEPDILGRAYEYLLKKFAEGQGQSAGEFYTPVEVAILMAELLQPEPGMSIYDPACGSGGLLIKCHLNLLQRYGKPQNGRRVLPPDILPLRLFGQEINPSTFAIARMNTIIHDMDADIRLGDTMRNPAFRNPDGTLQTFDIVVANPMWNQNFPEQVYKNDPYHRFRFGIPPSSSADWGWLQHMLASLNETGRMAVVLDTGAVSRGSGTTSKNREKEIRRKFVEHDLIEAVILLPENLFYNTTAPGIIILINKQKKHLGQILLINASHLFAKGRPKNYMTEEHIEQIARIYHNWKEEEGFSRIITNEEAARNDYNLSPSRYVASNKQEEVMPLEDAVVLLQEAEEERAEADRKLWEILKKLKLS